MEHLCSEIIKECGSIASKSKGIEKIKLNYSIFNQRSSKIIKEIGSIVFKNKDIIKIKTKGREFTRQISQEYHNFEEGNPVLVTYRKYFNRDVSFIDMRLIQRNLLHSSGYYM